MHENDKRFFKRKLNLVKITAVQVAQKAREKMNKKEYILDLIKLQDMVRLAWAQYDKSVAGKSLREIDLELTKLINKLGK